MAAIVLLIGGAGLAAVPSDSSPYGQVRVLPGTSVLSPQSVLGKDYRLHVFRARGANGKAIDMQAHLFDVVSAAGTWLSPDPTKVPPFVQLLSPKIRSGMQLFYNNVTDWLVVPNGWIIWHSSAGADGSLSVEFAAPTGPNAGWIMVNMEGGCYGCMLNDVAGFVPAATLVKAGYQRGLGYTSPNVKLEPRPSVLSHPDPCTALLTYSREKALIHGAVVMSTDKRGGALGVGLLYVGFPDSEAELGRFIAEAFLRTQMTRPLYFCAEAVNR